MAFAAIFLPLNQLPQQQHSTLSVLDIPKAQSAHTQHQSASSGTARFFVSSPAVAVPELRTSAEAGDVPDGVAGDDGPSRR